MHDETSEIFEKIFDWVNRDLKTVLATVTKTWKSCPRPVGSQMAVNQNCEFVGSLSGGCIEREVIEEAMDVIANGRAKKLSYGISHEDALGAGLSCGGSIEVYIELSNPDLNLIRQYQSEHRNFGLLSNLTQGKTECCDWGSRRVFGSAELCDIAKISLKNGNSGIFDYLGEQYFIKVWAKPLCLYIVGAVHISQALIPMAKIAGFEVVLIDPRSAFATPERFPDTKIICKWPEEAFSEIELNERSAVVVLSHDPKFDDTSLQFALSSDAFYIGALGSKKSQKSRIERLSKNGFKDEQLKRIHGPIGFDIGAKTSSHIAVAIIAELVSSLRVSG